VGRGDERYFDAAVETMDRAALDRMQEDKLLGDLVPWAYERSPLIRDTWDRAGITAADVQTMDDFREKVPFLDKDAIRRFRDGRNDPYGGLLCLTPDDHPKLFSAVFSTSGTTGDPTPVPSVTAGPSILVREFWEMGVRPGDFFTYALFTFRGPGIHHTVRGVGATPLFFDHTPLELPNLLRFSKEYRPTGWYTVSSPLILGIEQLAPGMGIDPVELFSSYEGIVYAGEPLSARSRRLLDEWGVTPFIHTGVGDCGAATECREHDGCHAWEDVAFVETLDPDGTEPVGDGERGELVASTLVDKIAPLIRYRSDDLVRVTRATCACGRTHARMWPLGRKGDEVVVQGLSVLPGDLWPAIEAVPETRAALFQVVRTGRECDVLRLRVGFAGDGEPPAGLRLRVCESVHAAVGVEPDVELVPNDVLLRQGPPHKIPRVVKA
jgi:phenylacetate-CoA ligase